MSEERRMLVLRAIVEDYVETSEPVGSRALLDRHQLGVSAATVRNDMAALEDRGLIVAPHTSAGRVPTDAGYRAFVDALSELKPMSRAERSAIKEFLEGAVDLDDVVDRTVRLLSTLTRQVAVVQYPTLSTSTVRHVELVPMGPLRLMIVLIVGTGRVEQHVVQVPLDLESDSGRETLARVRADVNEATNGLRLRDAAGRLSGLAGQSRPADAPFVQVVVDALVDALAQERETRVTMAGTANLVRHPNDFPESIEPVLDALEQHVVLLRLLAAEGHQDAVAVRIGRENPVAGLRGTSLVTTGYEAGGDRAGGLGVLGPTRMDYPTTMSSVRAVAAYLSRVLADR